MVLEKIQSRAGLIWIAGGLILLSLVLSVLYLKEKVVVEELAIEDVWQQRAVKLARLALDVPHYVNAHQLERDMYSDEEVFRHFIEVGLPQGLEYQIRDDVENAQAIQAFWRLRLQEVSALEP